MEPKTSLSLFLYKPDAPTEQISLFDAPLRLFIRGIFSGIIICVLMEASTTGVLILKMNTANYCHHL